MDRMATANGSPSPRARALAAALRKAREDKKISVRALADRLSIDQSHLSRIETGKRIPTEHTTVLILGALGTPREERERIIELARNAGEPNWLTVGMPGIPQQLAGAVESERAAEAITEWSPTLIPGLAQTSDYVRAIAEAGRLPKHEVESRVMVRAARREILTNRTPVKYDVLVDESALRRPIAAPEVMTEQLRHLIGLGEKPNVNLRIVPSGVGWHPGTAGPFVLYVFPDASPFVHFENYSSGAFVADSDDVDAYRKAIRVIGEHALSPEDSTRLVAQVIVDEWSA
jgi:transcriptional regulator with XRE-family HTH domain